MSVRVGLGIASSPFATPKGFFRWAELCESQGVDSLWQTDRLVSADPYLEPMSTMAALAGSTERIKFGMNAVVAPLRDPLVLAKQCATIDYLSGGRLLPMFGVGYPAAAEWRATGREAKGRGERADELFALLRQLWSGGPVTFSGRYFQYRDAQIAPLPLQRPLPLWIGGQSRAAIRRTARCGDGWIGGIATPEQVGQVIAAIRAELEHRGRHIDDDHYGASLVCRIGHPDDREVADFPLLRRPGVGSDVDFRPLLCVGSAGDLIERIDAYRRAGASKFVLLPIAGGEADFFDQTERLIGEVIPAVEDR